MRTKDEILLFLVRNSTPEYHKYPVSEDSNVSRYKTQRLHDLLLRLAGTTRYVCPEKDLKTFLGESVSFDKHLRPLMEDGTLHFEGVPKTNSFYDSPRYRKTFDKVEGKIRDYTTGQSWVAFHYRENNFLEDHDSILEDTRKLKLLK